MIYRILKLFFVAAIIPAGISIQSCSSSNSGGNEDRARPAVTLSGIVDANNADNEIIGEATLQWITDDSNPSTVDIYLSRDSGSIFTLIANDRPDNGAYIFDTNTVDDCRQCRVRIIARDIVGNVSDAADSAQDFIINNVPQVLGAAEYYDPDSNGPDDGDTIVVPFDKDLELRTGIASDIFILPVLGDSIGPFATVARGTHSNELVITMNGLVFFNGHIHIGKTFDPLRLHRTAPSGFNVRDNLSGGILFAPDTGRTAAAAEGIDIAPAFADSGQAIGSGTTVSVVLGDVDADGDQDMVEATTGNINVWLNDSTGNFPVSANQTIVIVSTSNILLGDVDGDGDLDIVAARNSNQPNLVYLNNGAGVFANSGQSLGATYTSAIALGDVDGDDDLDIVEGNFGQANRVLRNNGAGIFTDSGQALGSDNTNAIVLGDVDGDGDLDLIDGNQNQPKHVWRNDGSGLFTDTGQVFGNTYSTDFALGDVDGDGDLDLVEGQASNLGNKLWLNDGTGVFADSGQQMDALQTSAVMLSDVDGDDDLDLMVGNFGVAGSEWLNDGNGNFTDTGRSIGNANSNYIVGAVALGDLDGDYDLDIVLGEFGANQVWWNSLRTPPRNHIFIDSGQLLGDTLTTAVALGDVDGDGDLDMVEGNGLGQAGKLWLYNGTGGFTDSGQALGVSASSMVLGDVDGDGDLDIVEGNTNNLPNQVWLNNGAGVFTDSGQSLGAVSTSSIALADVDGDGDLDMLEGSYSQGVRVWRNNGSGIFTDSGQALGTLSGAIVTGDVDGDGDVDFVVVDASNTVWLNNGTGTFSSGQVFVSAATVTFALGDIDNDGDLDLFVGREENSTQVWVNNGLGTFADSGQVLGTNFLVDAISSNSLVLGDVDADGDLDLVQDNSNVEPNRVWINDGRGRFSSGQALGTNSYTMAMGDIDDDGDPDLVDANNGANQVWLNDY